MHGDGTQMFKEIGHDRVASAFGRSARRVRRGWNAKVVYEETVQGVRRDPQIASRYFYKPNHTVWTFGHPEDEEIPHEMGLYARDGRCLERVLEATAAKDISRYGIHHIRRKTGTAMGMSISPIKAEIVFADEEKRRLAQTRRLQREQFLEEGEDIRKVIFGCRYVDDLVLGSCTLCGE